MSETIAPITLLEVVNELNEIAPQIEFCAFGVTGEVVVGTGCCYILSGIAERVRELSKLAYQTVRQGMDDDDTNEVKAPSA